MNSSAPISHGKNKIPLFPSFKHLELEDRPEIEFITQQFEPYSDYNFVSLFSYDIKNEVRISKLNDNLVVRFSDYITRKPFYSFLGNSSLEKTISTLLEYVKHLGITPQLKLIPEATVLSNPDISSSFCIEEDRDNFDHIFSIEGISTLSGSHYEKKRYKVNLFKRNYHYAKVNSIQLTNKNHKKAILDTFAMWAKNKNYDPNQTIIEYKAIQKLLNHSHQFDLLCLGLWDKNKLVGFSITEITHNGYAISHFAKANHSYKGIFEFLYHKTAQELYEKGSTLLNREQDLGIVNLRAAKESWQPIKYLKKYTISHKKTI